MEIEADMELEGGAPFPPCDATSTSNCMKPDDISRGAGFAPANEQACVAASNGLGCEFSQEKNVFFPKCPVGFHVVVATPSLCSYNCPSGWKDNPRACSTGGLLSSIKAGIKNLFGKKTADAPPAPPCVMRADGTCA